MLCSLYHREPSGASLMKLAVVFCLLFVTANSLSNEDRRFCQGLECESKEDLLKVIQQLQDENRRTMLKSSRAASVFSEEAVGGATTRRSSLFETAASNAQCDICSSQPCQNGGSCYADSTKPWTSYRCDCPSNFAGSQCQTNITCSGSSCGKNTDCYVANHQLNCICKPGYSGDPKRGCTMKTKQTCLSGDPHYQTFDGLRFEYQGTCPYVFSQPCTTLGAPFAYYSVRAANSFIGDSRSVSAVSEIEVDFYNNTIHIDGSSRRLIVNGIEQHVPYYWPSKDRQSIAVKYSSGTFYVSNDQMIQVIYDVQGNLCVQVPDIPQFQGNRTLCGIGGNLDGEYKNDVVDRNGTVFQITSKNVKSGDPAFQRAEDSWITNNFLKIRKDAPACVTGEQVNNLTNCVRFNSMNLDSEEAVTQCAPIQDAMAGQGVFSKCTVLGNDTIQSMYDNCVYDVCYAPDQKCTVLQTFARTCQAALIVKDFGDWRTGTKCPFPTCPPHSQYEVCKSSCPASCADSSSPDFCDLPCSEGCTCEQGYVLDNTQISMVSCIPIEDCGCTDKYGNSYPGDGTTCEDIDECLDPKTCNVDLGHGNCTNTIGSYNCTCAQFYDQPHCDHYRPTRHCADLRNYWNYTSDGVYNITPPYLVPALKDQQGSVAVYCDMTTEGGGWTLMSAANDSEMTNRTYKNYADGFAKDSPYYNWLGLDLISGMTTYENTSLRLQLYRCAQNGLLAKTTDCTYKHFLIKGAAEKYAVVIPEVCKGTEKDYYDGWARWNLTQPGPAFVAFDNDDTNNCSANFRNTGWWFDARNRCGSANLNGVRYSCDNIPNDSTSSTYLFWGGSPLGQAWLYLRPTLFPNYDPTPP
ncbi:unnamed protein product [Cylicocyclus nassatus]|uniref:Uncharacterized protein n=1 Tax=Cylicocyclus nassatus TaxID=53992 RepID=A0AA36M3L0_CYLNA|nr:unnamed protein product [Cylicocyclus nassatus]